METARTLVARMAAYALMVTSVMVAAANEGTAAEAAVPDAQDRPRVLLDAGPDLQPAANAPPPDQSAAPAQPPGSGVARVKLAYEKSRSGQTAADYTAVIELCREGISAGVTQETRKYALRLMSWAHNRRGEARAASGHDAEALADFETAVHYDKTRWRAYHNRGVSYALQGLHEQAIADFNRTSQLNPGFANAYFNRGEMHYELRDFAAAIEDYGSALRLAPDDSAALNSRGHAFFQLGRFRQSVHDFTEALRLDPKSAAALTNRGDVFAELGFYAEALRDYHQSIAIDKSLGRTHQSVAWLVATCPDESYRDEALALSAANRAIELDGHDNPRYLDTLAAAYAEAGNFQEAQRVVQQAIQIASIDDAKDYRSRLVLYEQRQAYRSTPKRIAPTSSKEAHARKEVHSAKEAPAPRKVHAPKQARAPKTARGRPRQPPRRTRPGPNWRPLPLGRL